MRCEVIKVKSSKPKKAIKKKTEERKYRMKDFVAITGRSERRIYALRNAGRFPEPDSFYRGVNYWSAKLVEPYLDALT